MPGPWRWCSFAVESSIISTFNEFPVRILKYLIIILKKSWTIKRGCWIWCNRIQGAFLKTQKDRWSREVITQLLFNRIAPWTPWSQFEWCLMWRIVSLISISSWKKNALKFFAVAPSFLFICAPRIVAYFGALNLMIGKVVYDSRILKHWTCISI